jgi:D-threo-aldose 1-dehydrogenase
MSLRDKPISGPLDFGSAPLRSMFRNIPTEEAAATVDAAWHQSIRYFDTAPLYDAGLSEMRLGRALAKHKRDEYLIVGGGKLAETGARSYTVGGARTAAAAPWK